MLLPTQQQRNTVRWRGISAILAALQGVIDDAPGDDFDRRRARSAFRCDRSQPRLHQPSEAVRDLVRKSVDDERRGSDSGTCVASLSYVYNHRTRALAARLLDLQHANHTLIAAVTHIVLDHEESLETVLLRGPTAAVNAFTDQVIAERGVRFGAVNIVGVDANDDHDDPDAHHHNGHAHASPHRG